MAKKLSLLAAAVAVIALAVPAFASASKVTLPAGTLLAPGATLVGTSHNTTTETDLGTLECGTVTVNAELITNNGTTVRAVGTSAGTASCTVEEQPLTIDSPKMTELHATSSTSGTAVLSFKATLPGGTTCKFAGSAAVTYLPPTDSLHINGNLTPNEPVCGIGHIVGDFTITSGGTAVTLDN